MLQEKTYYWDRRPGNFVEKNTGEKLDLLSEAKKKFTPFEWFVTLERTIEDICHENNIIPTFPFVKIDTNSDLHIVFECMPSYRPYLSEKPFNDNAVGQLSNKFEICKNNSLPNDILVLQDTKQKKSYKIKVFGINVFDQRKE